MADPLPLATADHQPADPLPTTPPALGSPSRATGAPLPRGLPTGCRDAFSPSEGLKGLAQGHVTPTEPFEMEPFAFLAAPIDRPHHSASPSCDSAAEHHGFIGTENIAWVRSRCNDARLTEPPAPLGPAVAIASQRESFRLYSLFWRFMDHVMALFFLLFLMFLVTLLLTMQITLFFILFDRPPGPVSFFLQLTTLTFPIVCASLSVTIWRLMLNTAGGHEFMDLRLFLHLHLVRRRQTGRTMVWADGAWKPLYRTPRHIKYFIQVFHTLLTLSLLLIPIVAGAAVGIHSRSVSLGLQWLLTFSIAAAGAISILTYCFNLASYILQSLEAVRAITELRPRAPRYRVVVEYLNFSTDELIRLGLHPPQCALLSLDLYIDRTYGVFRKVRLAHSDAVSGWLTYGTPEFGSLWFLQILCMLLSTVLCGIGLSSDVPPAARTPLDALSLNAVLLPAAGLKLLSTILAILARKSTIDFFKERNLRKSTAPAAAASDAPAPLRFGLLTTQALAILSFAVSVILLWVLCTQSQYPVWLGAAFMPAIALGDLWALLPLIYQDRAELTWFVVPLAGALKRIDGLMAPFQHHFMWAKSALVVATVLAYGVLGIQAAVIAGFQFFVVLGLLICTTTLSGALVLRRRLHSTPAYWCFLFFYYLFALAILLCLQTAALEVPDVSEFIPNNGTNPGAARQYPVCGMRWRAHAAPLYEGLSIVDFALMDQIAALPNLTVGQQQLPEWFPSDWSLVFRSAAPPGQPRFDHLDNPALNLSVIAIRGTKTVGDIVQDIYLWAPAGVLQSFGLLVPLLELLPISVVRWWIKTASFDDWMNSFGHDLKVGYQYPILAYIQANCTHRQTIITGHSMGGSIGAVVGILLNLSIVSISGPGVSYSARKFDLPEDQDFLESTPLVTIMPDNDIVPRIDLQLGMVQRIACHSGLGYCHDLPSTICELLRNCGDPRGRLVHPKTTAPCLSYAY